MFFDLLLPGFITSAIPAFIARAIEVVPSVFDAVASWAQRPQENEAPNPLTRDAYAATTIDACGVTVGKREASVRSRAQSSEDCTPWHPLTPPEKQGEVRADGHVETACASAEIERLKRELALLRFSWNEQERDLEKRAMAWAQKHVTVTMDNPENGRCAYCVSVFGHRTHVSGFELGDIANQMRQLDIATEKAVEQLKLLVTAIVGQCPERAHLESAESAGVSVLLEVHDERRRAHLLHGHNSMESMETHDLIRLAILVEEVGEVAREFNEARIHDRPVNDVALRKELIQVAAMSTAWADALKGAAL